MFAILARLRPSFGRGDRSFFVHCQGTRARSCRESTDKLSSLFLDLAIEQNLPIVPVRFSGGLPVEPIQGKLEIPFGHARQDYTIGAAIEAAELAALAYRERRVRVLDALNSLGGAVHDEQPQPPDPGFGAAVAGWSAQTGARPVEATLFRILESVVDPASLTRLLVEGAKKGCLLLPAGPEGRWLAELAAPLFGPRGPELKSQS
jgi:hypothetical protein